MPKDFKSLQEVLGKEKAFEKVRTAAKEYEVLEKFSEIFPDLKKVADAVKIEKGVLFLKVENSVWKSELKFRQTTIIEKINKKFNEAIVKTIRFI
ncbi:MAG: hypothetical protein A2068_00915 [Ignavibacteria bacterium GWB2_35_6b]|nr:MAG: hypothetical protein A2068_00915 [Ignavibacteria bacterium GWB2_35_6b]